MNLLIMLLVQRGYVGKERIRSLLYPESRGEAFDRMFERDKDELRSIGVPIETGTMSGFDDEPGYRIRPDVFGLPEISLTSDEAAVVGLATRVWENASLAAATTEALRKLRSAGVDVDPTALELVQPRLTAEEPSFEVFFNATQERRLVEFDYRRSIVDEPTRRRLQPWGVVRFSGRWYVVGWDVDREAERVFRLSRVVGDARPVGAADAFVVPEGADVGAVTRRLAPQPAAQAAVVLVRPGSGHALRRAASSTTSTIGPDGETWDRLVLERVPADLVGEVLVLGADAVLMEPAELRRDLVARLREVVA
jgi:proteasome accessory factor B